MQTVQVRLDTDDLEQFGVIDLNAKAVAVVNLAALVEAIEKAPDVTAFTIVLKGEKFYDRCVFTLKDLKFEWGQDFKTDEVRTEK